MRDLQKLDNFFYETMRNYHISTNHIETNKEKIWSLLKECFWSKSIPIEYIEKFIRHSLCFGVYQNTNCQLVGFGRVITDFTTYAYICDVVIDPQHRKKGLGSALVSEIMNHPQLQGLKTWSLKTTDSARSIYQRNGFRASEQPETQLEINDLEIYSHPNFVNRCFKRSLCT